MRRISGVGLVFLLLCCIMAIAGCGDKKAVIEQDMFHVQPFVAPQRPEVDVYFDSTVSMMGYTTIVSGNLYRELPDELMDVGSSMGEIKFFSFGKEVKALSGAEYRNFINKDVYVELENSIKTVIDSAQKDHLTVIVTDLFESDAAWSAISSRIQDKYFKENCSVAIVGIKSPFDGTIYDVGLDASKFDYNSGNDASRYRPVYLLVMGPNAHVDGFLKRFSEKNLGRGNMKITKLSNSLMDVQPVSAQKMPEISIDNAVERDNLQIPDGVQAIEYKLPSLSEKTEIVRSFKYEPDRFGCKLDFSKIKPLIQGKYYDSEEESWKDFTVKNAQVFVEPSEEAADVYNVKISFVPQDSLKGNAVNGIMVSLVPEYDGLILPDWIKEWDLPVGLAGGSGFDGSKTVNLLRTVSSLKDSVLAVSRPSLANIELYFDLQ